MSSGNIEQSKFVEQVWELFIWHFPLETWTFYHEFYSNGHNKCMYFYLIWKQIFLWSDFTNVLLITKIVKLWNYSGSFLSLGSIIWRMILYRMCERSSNMGQLIVFYNLVCKWQQNILVCLLNKIKLIFLSAPY